MFCDQAQISTFISIYLELGSLKKGMVKEENCFPGDPWGIGAKKKIQNFTCTLPLSKVTSNHLIGPYMNNQLLRHFDASNIISDLDILSMYKHWSSKSLSNGLSVSG